jgi:hypothetical protein
MPLLVLPGAGLVIASYQSGRDFAASQDASCWVLLLRVGLGSLVGYRSGVSNACCSYSVGKSSIWLTGGAHQQNGWVAARFGVGFGR